jgi:hypothetical protein
MDNTSIYPNPATNQAIVKLNLPGSSMVSVQIMNSIGEAVRNVQAQGQSGINTIQVNLNGMASGIYLVTIKAGDASTTKKLVIE